MVQSPGPTKSWQPLHKIPLQEYLALIKAGPTESFHTAHLQIRSEKRMHPEGNFCKLSWFSASMQFLLWTEPFTIQAKKSRVNISNWKKTSISMCKKSKTKSSLFLLPLLTRVELQCQQKESKPRRKELLQTHSHVGFHPFLLCRGPPFLKEEGFWVVNVLKSWVEFGALLQKGLSNSNSEI